MLTWGLLREPTKGVGKPSGGKAWGKISEPSLRVVSSVGRISTRLTLTEPLCNSRMFQNPDESLDKLQVDFLGPFQPSTAHEYRYALQIQDILRRYLLLLPAEKDNVETASDVVFEERFLKFGPPTTIQSDRGTHFASQVFGGMCKLAGPG